MNFKKTIAMLLLATVCSGICACCDTDAYGPPEFVIDYVTTKAPSVTTPAETQPVDTLPAEILPAETQPAETTPMQALTPIDLETTGGIVIVGQMGVDEQGWYIQPEQPLNIKFEYFLEKPSVFTEQMRIQMFDPKVDGIEKALYIGQTVTASGALLFYRDDFETLYFTPYTITIGKNAEKSHSAPDLQLPDAPKNLYDPSKPLPKYMDPMIENGVYTYNAFMLSQETIERMGNDFADFYVGFVDAVLNYKEEIPCPDKNFAEMLSSVIFYDFPLYNAVAEPFEYFKDYNRETGTVSIRYRYDRAEYDQVLEKFFASANDMLSSVKPEQSDAEKAKNIYHAMSTRMTYDHSAMEILERKESCYAYLENSGVCITFANVYNQLLTQVDIPATLAHCDNPDTVGHSWSIITIDGKQYFCDPTFELSYDSGEGYRYFGQNYADRTANGFGSMGIRSGRYYVQPLDAAMIAETSLK